MPISTRSLSALTLTAAALALPVGAHASAPTGVDAVVSASARAEIHLGQAQQLLASTAGTAQAKARALVVRSRGELRSATTKAETLAANADGAVEIDAAVKATTTVSATLNQDTAVLADISVQAKGRLQSKAAAALVQDLRMQKQIVDATVALAGRSGADAKPALEGAIVEQQDVSAEIAAAVEVAGAHVGSSAKASADLAVGLGTQLIAATARTADSVQDQVHDSAVSTVHELQQLLGGMASCVNTTIAGAGIGDDEIAVSGHGSLTLGTLARLGLDATARVGTDAAAGPQARGIFSLLARR